MATTFRTLINRTGVIYNALKTQIFYAKDYNDHSVAINSLENGFALMPPLQVAIITVSSAEILDLYNTPKVLVNHNESSEIVEIVSAFAFLDYNSSIYDKAVDLYISYNTLTSVPLFSCENILAESADTFKAFHYYPTSHANMINGNSVVLNSLVQNPNSGNSDVYIYLLYRKLTF
jgi:hypothetical protein